MPRRSGIPRPGTCPACWRRRRRELHLAHHHHRLRSREDHDVKTKMCGRLGMPGPLARRGMWSIRLSSTQVHGRTRFDAGSVRLAALGLELVLVRRVISWSVLFFSSRCLSAFFRSRLVVRPSRRLFLGADRCPTPTRHSTLTGTSSAFSICTPPRRQGTTSSPRSFFHSFHTTATRTHPRRRSARAPTPVLVLVFVLPRPRYPPHLPIHSVVPSSAPALVPSTAAPTGYSLYF
ncbi:hypothetical protein B0H17DRAFT_11870 [Mycena rosella]|uniref:Uncharacterized protein n=1 Tax=Mycena rosella TaxID=1033263 RepID=A0AAD7M7G6_MYCRO|nr:hypothetical protein B0H17DRAFT_11870 [Mycena rosella]